MSNLSDIAKRSVGNGGLTGGLEKMTTDEVIKTYPNGVSITGTQMINLNGDSFPVFTFAEDTSKYFCGGTALREMVESWLEAYDEDVSAINNELQAEHIKIKMRKIKTKAGRTFTTVTILGTVQAFNPDTG